MSNANDTRTRNRYWKPVPENWYHFSDIVFFVPDETWSKISGLIFLYYCPPIHFKSNKTTNNTTYINKQHNWRSSEIVLLCTRFRYWKKLIPIRVTHLQKTDTGFLVGVFGTGFWCVCHWHKNMHVMECLCLAGNKSVVHAAESRSCHRS